MAFTKVTDDVANISKLSDRPNLNDGLTAAQLKSKFDEAGVDLKTYINDTLIAELESTTDSASGADNIGATAITGVTGATVQTILEDLKTQINTKTPTLNAEKQGFDTTTPTPVSATGDVAWNTSRETLDVKLSTQVTGQMFQENHIFVRNTSGSPIADGTLVMRTGVNSDRITVAPAVCNGSVPATDILGVATETISNNANGRVTVFGEVSGLDTSAYTIGTELWGNPSVAGGLTSTKPSAPNLKVSVGIVTKSHGTNGILLVQMNHGSVLGGTDSNVELASLTDKDLLSYESATGIWKNKTIANAGAVALVGDQTVAGVKTFSSSPVIPSPTTDMQAATKKYVDDKALTVGDPHWKAPVATKALLPTTGNSLGDIRSVFDDGDGKQAVYECKATTGTIDQQWAKIADVDWLTEEATRVANENARVSAEQGRVNAENGRVSAESARVDAEILRQAHITDKNNPHEVTYTQIGAAPTSHTHAQSDITNLVTDLGGKVPTTRTVNGKALSSDVTLTFADVNSIEVQSNAGFHNSIYRGKYLGTSVTAAQYTAISSGAFTDLYIGDYWTIGGVNYRIAGFNYFYNVGDTALTTHHAVIVPDTQLYTAQMNATNDTTGAYVGSAMRTANLTSAITTIKSAFSGHVIKHRQLLVNATSGGKASGWAWYDCEVELMNEVMVYGSVAWGSNTNGYEVATSHGRLPLFTLRQDAMNNRQNWWLRDVVSASTFANVAYVGVASSSYASDSLGVRPAFSIS